jgi:L-asparaginase II
VLSLGDVDRPVFLRSSAKPFIASAVCASGAAERFGFDAREIAVASASHNGEPFHVVAVRSMLSKIGLNESALRCGVHPPAYEPAAEALFAEGKKPSAIYNNCSGKHAAILAMCVHRGYDIATYLEREHPAQREILEFCARMCQDDASAWPVAVDGCGIPVFATPLRRAALAFARFATLEGIAADDTRALALVRASMAAEPAYVGGAGRFDSALIETTSGRIVCKAGAEGVHGDALTREGLGLAMKVLDGNRRATPPAVVALLQSLSALEPSESEKLAAYAEPDVRNVAGRIVGKLKAASPP